MADCGDRFLATSFISRLVDCTMGVAQTKDKDKGQSVTLDLKEKPLEKWLAEAKGYLKQIEKLDLSRQELAELPPQIAKLVNLKFLQIYDNHLKSIPREIGTFQAHNHQFLVVGHSTSTVSLPASAFARLHPLSSATLPGSCGSALIRAVHVCLRLQNQNRNISNVFLA